MRRSRPVDAVELDRRVLEGWPLPVDPNGDKHQRGTVLVIGGLASTPGAVVLAGSAALRMGAGRLQIATEPSVAEWVAVTVPESKVVDACLDSLPSEELTGLIAGASSILVGPGLDPTANTAELLRLVFEQADTDAIVVVDAAAIAALPQLDRAVIRRVAGRLVLTPNRQEFGQLADADADADDIDEVAQAAERFGAVITTFAGICASDGRGWRCSLGHPSLGTSGSGDVLGGFVAGVAARTGDSAQSACWGTFAHAQAGHLLGERYGQIGFLAHELIDVVAQVVPRQ